MARTFEWMPGDSGVQWAQPQRDIDLAAQRDDLEALKCAYGAGQKLDEVVFAYAAGGGSVAVLEWLRDNKCPCDETACRYASDNGRLAALQWLRVNGYPWDYATLHCAAYNNHLDVFTWAYENECPKGRGLCATAWISDLPHFIHWMHTRGCTCNLLALANDWPMETPTCYYTAVAWLYAQDPRLVPWAQPWLTVVHEELKSHLLPDVAKHIVEKYI